MSDARRKRLEALLEAEGLGRAEATGSGLGRRPPEAPLELSVGEEQLWFLSRVVDRPAAYHMPFLLDLGRLVPGRTVDAARLAFAVAELARRHDALSSAFPERDGGPSKAIVEGAAPRLVEVDLRALAPAESEAALLERAGQETARPFDLGEAPLWRAVRFLTPRGDELLLVFHHIVFDGWSLGVLVRELAALLAGEDPGPAAPIAYADFAHWQRRWLGGEEARGHLEFWREALRRPPVLDLPTDRPRGARQGFRGDTVPLAVDPQAARALAELARAEGATPFMAVLAAVGALLGRLGGLREVLLGTGVANRDRRATHGVVGFFANLVALRLAVGADAGGGAPSLRELVRRARRVATAAFAHQEVPFETLVEALEPERDASRNPFFQVIVTLEEGGSGAASAEAPVRALATGGSKFDLSFDLRRSGEGEGSRLEGALEYAADLFDAATAEAMAGRFARLLAASTAEPDRPLDAFDLRSEEERASILAWNDTATDFPRDRSVAALFAQQVGRSPEAVALESEGERLSFGELAARARRLAHHLRGLGVRPEVPVALVLPRTVERVVAILAVVEAGGFFIPLDAEAPPRRLGELLEEAGARVVVGRGEALARLEAAAAGSGRAFVDLAAEAERIAALPADPLPGGAGPENLLYVMFTSGSTGRPKGVATRHGNVARLVLGNRFAELSGQTFLQLAPAAFDASTLEIWGPLLTGGRLVVFPPEPPSLERLGEVIERTGVSTLWLTAGLFHEMVDHRLDSLLGLTQLLAGGDVLSPDHVRRFTAAAAGRVTLINGYGPTEGTTFATTHAMPAPVRHSGGVPIGRPIADTRAHVLDAALRPVPPAVTGELHLGGDGLARGYLGRPGLTAERFVPAPAGLGEEPGARLYRTGDRVRWLPAGDLEFCGRTDGQVKLRGFRVEPAEVEHALAQHPAVASAVVVVWSGEDGEKRLVAYSVPAAAAAGPQADGLDPEALRGFLAERLPLYMVPSAFVALERLPLTGNGKVDRRALPPPALGRAADRADHAAPQGPTEELLAALWREVLGVDRVDRRDNWFDLGGHSLRITRLASGLRRALGIDVPLALLFETPGFADLAARLDRLARERQRAAPAAEAPAPEGPFEPLAAGPAPASFGQERLWFLDRLAPGSAAFNIPLAVDLRGPLDGERLARALTLLVERHGALSTRFVAEEGRPVQERLPPFAVELPLVEAEAGGAAGIERRLAATPFDLGAAPLWRAALLRSGAGAHRLVWVLHHAIADGWSVDLLLRELAAAYAALGRREPWAPTPERAAQSADHARWQRRLLAGGEAERQLAYWRSALAGVPALDLPTDRQRPAVQGAAGARVELPLSREVWARAEELGRRLGATPFMVGLAAFRALLSRTAGARRFAIGTPIAGRPRRELETVVGCCVNALALATPVEPGRSFSELATAERRTALDAYAHQDLPFERLVEAVDAPRDLSRPPLFQVTFTVREVPRPIAAGGLRFALSEIDNGTSKYDLTLGVGLSEEAPRLVLEYACDLFDAATAEALLGRYAALLRAAVESPETPVARLPLFSAGEAEAVARFSVGRPSALPERSLVAVLEERAAHDPDAPALESADGAVRIRRGELVGRARGLARGLRAAGVGLESPVGVLLERSCDQVLAFLGVLFAGGCYVPLDPDLPEERLGLLIEDAGVEAVVTREPLASRLPARAAGRALGIESLARAEAAAGEVPLPRPQPSSLAYVMYTSGSTGRPKGVGVEHRSVAHLAGCGAPSFAGETLLYVSPAAFDASTLEIWAALLAGDRLVVHGPERPSFASLARAVEERGVSTLFLTTGLLHQMVEHRLEALALPRRVMTGGDVLSAEAARRFLAAPGAGELVNCYGPTEATVYAAIHAMADEGDVGAAVPLGGPIPDAAVRVLDPLLQPQPPGVAGELHIGGAGLARGYLGRPALTAERFVPDPFASAGGSRLYRTGDLVRGRRDGRLEFLGRRDHQVKLRGFRIEPGEVRAALERRPEVGAAAVLVRPDATGEKRLLAWVAPAPGATVDPRALAEALAAELPSFMLPAAIVPLAALPLTGSGKLDAAALPDPEAPAAGEAGGEPVGPVEEVLAAIFCEVLGLERVGREADFFDLGGHSLRATRAAARIARDLGVDLPLRELFQTPRLSDLAALVESRRGGAAPGGEAVPGPQALPRPHRLPLSFAQERLWFLGRLDPQGVAYHVPAFVRLAGDLDAGALERALDQVVARHEVLRTTFHDTDEGAVQVVAAPARRPLPRIDLAARRAGETKPGDLEAALAMFARAKARRPFDLETEAPLRAVLYRLAEDDHALLLVFHHIAADWWSLGVFFRELREAYGAAVEGREPELPELPIQYADYALWQRRALAGEALDRQLDHWRRRLADLPDLDLPTDRPAPPGLLSAGDSIDFDLGAETTAALEALARRLGATPFMALLALWQLVLHRATGQGDFAVGCPVAGRNRPEVEGLVGFFVNTLVLRADLRDDPSFAECVRRAREATLDAHAHPDVPFERLVEALAARREVGSTPLFQVQFSYQNELPEAELPGLSARFEPFDLGVTKFPLSLGMGRGPAGLTGTLTYASDRFERETAGRMVAAFRRLAAAAAAAPERRAGELPYVDPAEAAAIAGFSAPRRDFAEAALTVHRLVETRAAAYQLRTAVVAAGGSEALAYGALLERARRLAHRLRGLGVGPESRVALALPRSADLVTAMLGALGAGAAYLPLDVEHPPARRRRLLERAGVSALVTAPGVENDLPPGVPVVELLAGADLGLDSSPAAAGEWPVPGPEPENLAYVLFTSGSTGEPKAVAVEHRQLVDYLLGVEATLALPPGASFAFVSTPSADLGMTAIWGALLSGGAVHVVERSTALDPEAMARYADEHRLDALKIAPSHLVALLSGSRPEAVVPRRLLVMGGEAVSRELLARLDSLRPGLRVLNSYGPTETAVSVSTHEVGWGEVGPGAGPVPLGPPMPNARFEVLDRMGRRLGVGGVGELSIGGRSVTRGYLGQPARTAERFVPDPFAAEPGARLYRTGDRMRWRPTGELDYLGRRDHQVKVRGFRIELAEVEAALAADPAVARAAALATGEGEGRRLVAFVVPADPSSPPDPARLRRDLGVRLPEPMVPSRLHLVDALPLNSNGKLDRRALAAQAAAVPEAAAPQGAPRPSSTARRLAELWRRLLGVETVRPEDNFFDLGGHSLLLVRLQRELRRELGAEVAVVDLFAHPTVASLARFLDRAGASPVEEERPRGQTPRRRGGDSEAVAIVGMAGRFPGARDLETFWDNLRAGVESIRRFTREEQLASGLDPALLGRPELVPAGGALDGVDRFDAGLFRFRPREAALTDPQQRLFLECSWEALEDAGIDPERFGGRIGAFAGAGQNSYFLHHVFRNPALGDQVFSLEARMGNDKDFLPSRVAYKLGLEGPAVAVQTACSTSLVALHLARRSLLDGECDAVLAGGVRVHFPQATGYLYQEGGVVSPDGHCRAFDAAAAGAVPGDGCGVVVLMRLADAIERGAPIRAVVRGSAINNDGSAKVGYSAPSVEGQARVIRDALAAAGVEACDVDVVEAHGTGTPLGDPIEVAALRRVFGAPAGDRSCLLGSVKTNIGHVDAAAGVAGVMKTVLALEHGEVPPSLHFERPNPALDLPASPFRIAAELTPWPRRDERARIAGVSSFGIGGTNAHAVLEEAPRRAAREAGGEPAPRLLVLSAHGRTALDGAGERLAAFLEQAALAGPGADLADVAHTLMLGRRRLDERRVVVARDLADAAAALRDSSRRLSGSRPAEGPPSLAFLFSGQGSQHPGMGRRLYRHEPRFRAEVDRAAEILRPILGLDLRALLYPQGDAGPAGDEREAAELLAQTRFTQPALFVVELALARLWGSWGVEPAALLGHSIGELTAACLAGVWSLEDALALVAERGRLVQEQAPGAMASVPLDSAQVEERLERDGELRGEVSVAVVNGPGATVVAGPEEAVDAFRRRLAAEGVPARRLKVSHAFHSPMMAAAADAFERRVAAVAARPPAIPIVSSATGTWLSDEEAVSPAYWARQLHRPVRFADGVATLLGEPGRVFLEVGPGVSLGGFVRRIQKRRAGAAGPTISSLPRPTEGDADDFACALEALGRLWIAGIEPEFAAVDGRGERRFLRLPTYAFERRRYWIEPVVAAGGTAGGEVVEGGGEAGPAEQTFDDRPPELPNEYAAPADEMEERLVSVWSDLFGVRRIGVTDGYFALGGDSLLATQLVARLRAALGLEVTVAQLMEANDIRGLAATCRALAGDGGERLASLVEDLAGLSIEDLERLVAMGGEAP